MMMKQNNICRVVYCFITCNVVLQNGVVTSIQQHNDNINDINRIGKAQLKMQFT